MAISTSLLSAQTSIRNTGNKAKTVEVEVKRYIPRNIQNTDKKTAKGNKEEKVIIDKVNLKFITYNQDKSLFVGYYQSGWDEMVSLHDAKTKKQLGSVYCGGGVPTVYRFSKDGNFLGAKASVGWYVWKIPSFEKVFILGDIDFQQRTKQAEGGADQATTAPESKPQGDEKPKKDLKARPQ